MSKAQDAVSLVDLDKYSGKWFLIASIPTKMDKSWNYVTESYSVKPNGNISIYTTYIKANKPGSKKSPKEKHIRSKGFPKKGTNNFGWKVQFWWPFKVDYLIEELAPDYSYTVVGHPKKKFLYIMCREKTMDENVLKVIIERCRNKGYDTKQLQRIAQ
jgi:apolipoprotein D and lipocalin family protein